MEIELKSKFDAEFRRCRLQSSSCANYEDFQKLLKVLHKLDTIEFVVQYIDETDTSLLPINNDDNFRRAISMKFRPLRIIIQRKGCSYGELHGFGQVRSQRGGGFGMGGGSSGRASISKLVSTIDSGASANNRSGGVISMLEDFRRVSSIIDVDLLPVSLRRVKLMRNCQRPLGFYIRDGESVRASPTGIEKTPAVFISRLIPNGLAESTGLLAIGDEIVEVNGIEVKGKSLDQVTDMMVANSSNLIITVKPVNQNMCLPDRAGIATMPANTAVKDINLTKMENVYSL